MKHLEEFLLAQARV